MAAGYVANSDAMGGRTDMGKMWQNFKVDPLADMDGPPLLLCKTHVGPYSAHCNFLI